MVEFLGFVERGEKDPGFDRGVFYLKDEPERDEEDYVLAELGELEDTVVEGYKAFLLCFGVQKQEMDELELLAYLAKGKCFA